MKKSVIILFLVILTGCSAGSDFVSRVGGAFESFMTDDSVAVIYPAEPHPQNKL